MDPAARDPAITVTRDGPYRMDGDIAVTDARGAPVTRDGPVSLCRCGGSQNKPFCDGTHARTGFDGTETAPAGPVAERRDVYQGDGITIYDDRSLCAHVGVCTARLPTVWQQGAEPWIDPAGADAEQIAAVVQRCPSGALAFARAASHEPVEAAADPAIEASADGPYYVRGGVQVTGSDGTHYEARNRQALCRCGGSSNKPFCDGTHWRIGFTDPADGAA